MNKIINNRELCNAVKDYVQNNEKINWNNDTSISTLERILAHFELSDSKINNMFYDRNKEISDLLEYLNTSETKNDEIWIFNQISEISFSPEICKLSPQFIKTYYESNIAYKQGLYMICGNGFRKALEYLVYDYAVFKYPDKKNKIQKKRFK